ncbi:DUF4129 domain-containing protein [Pseudoxanthomonas sacheonensis]|uniref:DUF4129 domain-containing protein n=1 Tax=Pseudoxanthomonas sacheonensis TaxID=443615 RepID=UPI0013D5DA69|nr:DUF4129 domain-containing protein [Pseudoxanthomonas sacheonensis]KAF1710926.1 DUF4129 domain-containing protein [Pseudoxanthomonas sacheonensis]
MRLEQMTVHLRSRSAWEAVELGTALVRRHAAAIWKPWLLVTVPLFVALNAAAWAIDSIWLAGLLMWWLKPVFDRIPLFVVSRATFGATPSVREALLAQLRWGWQPMLHYLTWRRFSPARTLYLPIDLLEGVTGARLRERRRVLGGAVYGNAALLTLVCLNFELSLVLGGVGAIFLFVDVDNWLEALRLIWNVLVEEPKWWAQIIANGLVWIATSVIEPFFVGAGFGLYLNRRTQIEAWDVEIAFRKLRARLTAAAAPFALVLALLGAGLAPARAQEAQAPATPAKQEAPTLPAVFGDARVDERAFSKAVDQAYRDPLLNSRSKQVTWEKRDKPKPKPPSPQRDMSWLSGFGQVFAFIAEWGLWILVGGLVAILLLTLRHWLPWMRGSLRRHKPLPVDVETEALQLPEILPDNVPAEARRLWVQGKPRHALALLYRASVETMARRAEVALPPGATESECLRASRRMPDGEDRSLFARMVRVWQYAAYAQQLPAQEEFDDLLSSLQQRYRWAA